MAECESVCCCGVSEAHAVPFVADIIKVRTARTTRHLKGTHSFEKVVVKLITAGVLRYWFCLANL